MSRRRVVIAVTGASGSPYAARVLGFLAAHAAELELDPHVVFTKFGRLVWGDEVGVDPASYGFPTYAPSDMLAPFASGSAGFDAMVVVPCSVAALARIATGVSSDLVSRAADVMLKERRRLVLVVRESPYNLVHLRNMVTLVEAGAVVMPASPSFYSAPTSVEQLLDTVTARVLDQIGVPNALMQRWTGELRGGKS
ncbi:MAG: UbiX family flavin prenyltransferase [Myxococcota bacterium]